MQKAYSYIDYQCNLGGTLLAEQVLVQVRVDKKLKEEVSEIYEMLGLDLPTAIRMFLVRSKLERGLPFKAVLPEETVSPAEMVEILKK